MKKRLKRITKKHDLRIEGLGGPFLVTITNRVDGSYNTVGGSSLRKALIQAEKWMNRRN